MPDCCCGGSADDRCCRHDGARSRREIENHVDNAVEQFDFAIDSLIEAHNYLGSALSIMHRLDGVPLTLFDQARLNLVLARTIEECEDFVESYSGSSREQVRGEAHGY